MAKPKTSGGPRLSTIADPAAARKQIAEIRKYGVQGFHLTIPGG